MDVSAPRARGVMGGRLACLTSLLSLLFGAVLAACGPSGTPRSTGAAPTAAARPTATPAPAASVHVTSSHFDVAGPMELEVVESGFTYAPGDPPVISFAAVIDNPNETWAAEYTWVSVTFHDDAGNVDTGPEQRLWMTLPGQRTAIADWHEPGFEPTAMEVEIGEPQWRKVEPVTGALVIEEVTTAGGEGDGPLVTTGVVRSSLDEDFEAAIVTAVYYNDAGAVIGGDVGPVGSPQQPDGIIPSGGEARFEVQAKVDLSGVARTQAYVMRRPPETGL